MKEEIISVQIYTDAVRLQDKGKGLKVTVLPESGSILGLVRPSKKTLGELIQTLERYVELDGGNRPLLDCTQDVLYNALRNPQNIGVNIGQEDF